MITPRYKGPQVDPHVAWTKVKASAMKRPYLDCGCRNDGVTDTYLHLGCARIACKTHADDPHECQHYEPEPEPRELFPPEVVETLDAATRRIDEVLRATAYPRGTEEPVIGDVIVTRLGGVTDPRVQVDRADPYARMSVELFEAAHPDLLRVHGDVLTLGTEGLGLGVVSYRIVQREAETGMLLLKRLCCDLHGSNCEQGGEECCGWCTEAHHFEPGHGGMECSAPVRELPAEEFSSGEWLRENPGVEEYFVDVTLGVDVSRDGTGAVSATTADGHLMIVDETRHLSPEELERFAAEWRSSRAGGDAAFRTYWLNAPVRSEPDAPPADAALQARYHDVAACEVCRLWRESERPDLDHSSHSMQWVDGCPECPSAQDRPQRRTAAVTDLARSTEADAPRHVDTRGAGRFHTEQDNAGEWYEVPCDCPTEGPRRPWWRFW
jgi:hypothetical protein